MNIENLCIATISWARNEAEENLLRTSLQGLALLHIPVYITDGGSNVSFLEFLQSIPHFTVLKTEAKGVYAQAKNSLLAAYETNKPFVFYTEPDKEAFFQKKLNQLLNDINEAHHSGIHMASRSAEGFATFPAFQQMTETTINNCCKEIIGEELDYTYGPFLLSRKLIPYLHEVTEDIGWGWRPYLFILAHRLGLKVEASVSDFVCPPDQQENDQKERIYRMRQLEQNIRGIVLGASAELITSSK